MVKPLVTIIGSVAERYDAISTAAWHTYQSLIRQPDWDVAVIAGSNSFDDLPVQVVHGSGSLLVNPAFLNADVLIYHFGTYHPFFDALLIGNGCAKQIVCFHNITPPELLPAAARKLTERALRQMHNLQHADRIWAVSQFNANALIEHGISHHKIEVIPLAVDQPDLWDIRAKRNERLELLFLGRVVESKGVVDCIHALSSLREAGVAFNLSIAGSLTFADPKYLARCRALVSELDLEDSVQFLGTLSEASLAEAYKRADIFVIPSYHEGFCVPVVECLRSGCIPVGYAAGNIPNIANGFGRLVPPGDIKGLGHAIHDVAAGLAVARQNTAKPCLMLDGGTMSADEFNDKTRDYVSGFTGECVHAIQANRVKSILTQGC